jgi:hypothetical protein
MASSKITFLIRRNGRPFNGITVFEDQPSSDEHIPQAGESDTRPGRPGSTICGRRPSHEIILLPIFHGSQKLLGYIAFEHGFYSLELLVP